jgi:hypothetical protein
MMRGAGAIRRAPLVRPRARRRPRATPTLQRPAERTVGPPSPSTAARAGGSEIDLPASPGIRGSEAPGGPGAWAPAGAPAVPLGSSAGRPRSTAARWQARSGGRQPAPGPTASCLTGRRSRGSPGAARPDQRRGRRPGRRYQASMAQASPDRCPATAAGLALAARAQIEGPPPAPDVHAAGLRRSQARPGCRRRRPADRCSARPAGTGRTAGPRPRSPTVDVRGRGPTGRPVGALLGAPWKPTALVALGAMPAQGWARPAPMARPAALSAVAVWLAEAASGCSRAAADADRRSVNGLAAGARSGRRSDRRDPLGRRRDDRPSALAAGPP